MTAEHGTVARYVNDRCRCDECRGAKADYERERRARRAGEATEDIPQHYHLLPDGAIAGHAHPSSEGAGEDHDHGIGALLDEPAEVLAAGQSLTGGETADEHEHEAGDRTYRHHHEAGDEPHHHSEAKEEAPHEGDADKLRRKVELLEGQRGYWMAQAQQAQAELAEAKATRKGASPQHERKRPPQPEDVGARSEASSPKGPPQPEDKEPQPASKATRRRPVVPAFRAHRIASQVGP